jgi:hypothetical protein
MAQKRKLAFAIAFAFLLLMAVGGLLLQMQSRTARELAVARAQHVRVKDELHRLEDELRQAKAELARCRNQPGPPGAPFVFDGANWDHGRLERLKRQPYSR